MNNTYFRHIKTQGIYRVEGRILNKSTNEPVVLYQSIKDHKFYVRTVYDFEQKFEEIDTEKFDLPEIYRN